MLWLLACTAPTDSSPIKEVSTSGWKQEQLACESPVALAWETEAGTTDFGPYTEGDRDAGGEMALWEYADQKLLITATPQGPLLLENLFPREPWGPGTQDGRFTNVARADLNGDGGDELLLLGDYLLIYWSGETDPPESTILGGDWTRNARETTPLDMDQDGDLDLLVSYTSPDGIIPASIVMENKGDGSFEEPYELPEPAMGWGRSFDSAAVDLDRDGWPDLYQCNDMGRITAPNVYFSNQQGSLVPNVGDPVLEVISSCMGAAWADLDNDLVLDLVLGDAERLWLFQYFEGAGYVDITANSGLPSLAMHQMIWGVAAEDLDNDGLRDLVLPTSWFRDGTAEPWPVWVGMAQSGGGWVESGASMGMPQEADIRTVITEDINEDGVLDLIFGDGTRSPWILKSTGCTQGNWVEIKAPEGSLVEVDAGGQTRIALVTADASYGAAHQARAHIGLGSVQEVEEVRLFLIGGEKMVLEGPIPVRTRLEWAP